MTESTGDGEVPDGVGLLLRDAVRGRLLTDADGMATALARAGWVRGTVGGSWACAADPSWTVQSTVHPPSVSVFTVGWDRDVARATTRLLARLDAGEAGLARGSGPGADRRSWSGGGVLVSLQDARQRWLGTRLAPAMLQLAVEPADASDDLVPDPARARRTAREGSPVARWYLAADASLPEDVVELLSHDEDPLVVAALSAAEAERRLVLGDG